MTGTLAHVTWAPSSSRRSLAQRLAPTASRAPCTRQQDSKISLRSQWIERCATSARLAFASNRFAEKPPAEVGENEHDPRAHTRTGRDRALERCRLRTGDRRACRAEAAAAQFRVPTLGPGVARCLRVTRSRPAEHAVRQRKTVLTRLAQGAPPSPSPSQDQSRHRSAAEHASATSARHGVVERRGA
jgi:hypothetical protein